MLKLEYYLVYSTLGDLKARDLEKYNMECIKSRGPRSTVSAYDQSDRLPDAAKLEGFVARCLEIYGSRPMDSINGDHRMERFPEDDAGLLAASALIRLYHLGDHQDALLRAATVLQHVISVSPFNYEALVMMTVLCAKLGNGWEAAECYNKLSIKNIQLPTASWLLCTRISTIHPHTPYLDYGNTRAQTIVADPIQHLSQALDYHLHLREINQQEMVDFLEKGRYASLAKAVEDGDHNQNGIVKYMLFLEFARTMRLSGTHLKPEYQGLLGGSWNSHISDLLSSC